MTVLSKTMAPVVKNTSLLMPRLVASHFLEIDFEPLRSFPYLILDVDNTISHTHAPDMEAGVQERVQRLRQGGAVRDVCLVSNVIFRSRHALDRLQRFAGMLGSHYVATGFWRRKPHAWGFLEALRLMKCSAQETIMVGDQIYTDVLGANRLGMFTILVRPLGPDHWTTDITGRRRREAAFLKSAGLSW